MIARPGNMDIQLDLFHDYANNVKLLSNIPGILPETEAAVASDLGEIRSVLHSDQRGGLPEQPKRVRSISGNRHFALETHVEEVASAMRSFLQKTLRESA